MFEPSGYEFIRRDRCPACKSQDHQTFWGRRASQRGGLFPWRHTSIDLPVFRCEKCALTYSNPLPIHLSMSQHYGMDPENYWPEQYFKLDPNFSPVDFQKIENLIPGIPKAGMSGGLSLAYNFIRPPSPRGKSQAKGSGIAPLKMPNSRKTSSI